MTCFFTALLLIAIVVPGNSQQSFEDFQRQQNKAFKDFRSKQDKDFTGYLLKDWKEFQAFKARQRFTAPKVKTAPRVESGGVASAAGASDVPASTRKVETEVLDTVTATQAVKLAVPPGDGELIEVVYYDTPLQVRYDAGFKIKPTGTVDSKFISNYWDKASRTQYDNLLTQTNAYKKQLDLNDWGYVELLNSISTGIYTDSPNVKNLFIWYLLCKGGYDARVGYKDGRSFLLMPSDKIIYGVSFFTIDDKDYYVIPLTNEGKYTGTLYVHGKSYPGVNKFLNTANNRAPKVEAETLSRRLKFQYEGQDYSIVAKYSKGAINYYNSYPQTSLDVYFDASVSATAQTDLLNQLGKIISGKTETEAVNVLLRFVQTAFEYKTDDDQFGEERALFAEEALFYAANDCEDRSILFSYLVRKLVKLDVIGLHYPGHVATAVRFTDEIRGGDQIMYKQKAYLICDPTYINSNIGMAMPQFKTAKIDVIWDSTGGVKGSM